jgi:hypothetical protein
MRNEQRLDQLIQAAKLRAVEQHKPAIDTFRTGLSDVLKFDPNGTHTEAVNVLGLQFGWNENSQMPQATFTDRGLRRRIWYGSRPNIPILTEQMATQLAAELGRIAPTSEGHLQALKAVIGQWQELTNEALDSSDAKNAWHVVFYNRNGWLDEEKAFSTLDELLIEIDRHRPQAAKQPAGFAPSTRTARAHDGVSASSAHPQN